jgi:hypothetical protein
MNVKCIDVFNMPHLSLNVIYEVVDPEAYFEQFEIYDDSGRRHIYRSSRFVEVAINLVSDIKKLTDKTDELIAYMEMMVFKRDTRIEQQDKIIKQLLSVVDSYVQPSKKYRVDRITNLIHDLTEDWI